MIILKKLERGPKVHFKIKNQTTQVYILYFNPTMAFQVPCVTQI
jgi:hypothetical protein